MAEIMPEFELIDAVEHQKEHRRTFELPDEWNRNHVASGEWAKLMFRFPANRFPEVERMWVRITEVTASGYIGVLDNTPDNVEFIGYSQRIIFEPGHIISIWPPRMYFESLTPESNEPVAYALRRTAPGGYSHASAAFSAPCSRRAALCGR
jgi:hypothetical protein